MQQPPQSQPSFTHSGQIYLLGYGPDYYGIWDRRAPGPPVARFPMTEDGWRTAWQQFSAWEPQAVAVPPQGAVQAPAAGPGAMGAGAAAPQVQVPGSQAVPAEAAPPPHAAIPAPAIPVTTAWELPGRRVAEYRGVAIGLIVRSMGAIKGIGASFKALRAGEVTQYTQLLEETRRHAMDRMIDHARALGADSVIGMRFDSSEIGETLTEILAYGTAVRTESAG